MSISIVRQVIYDFFRPSILPFISPQVYNTKADSSGQQNVTTTQNFDSWLNKNHLSNFLNHSVFILSRSFWITLCLLGSSATLAWTSWVSTALGLVIAISLFSNGTKGITVYNTRVIAVLGLEFKIESYA